MYHSCTPQYNKDILESLRDPNGVVRIVFATVALGMGINLQDVNTIIHYGAPCVSEKPIFPFKSSLLFVVMGLFHL